MKQVNKILMVLSVLMTATFLSDANARGSSSSKPVASTTQTASDIYYETIFKYLKGGSQVLLTCGINQKDFALLKPVFYADGRWNIQTTISIENKTPAEFIGPYFYTGQLDSHQGSTMFLGNLIGQLYDVAEAGIKVLSTNDVRLFYTTDFYLSAIEVANCRTSIL